jgi:O-antigen/teichoic acid export membrane protein
MRPVPSHVPRTFSFAHLFRGSALYGSSDVVVALVRFSLIAVYTRIMPPAEFGLYSLIITSLTLAVVFVPLGLPSAVMLRLNPADMSASKALKDEAFRFLVQLCLVCGAVFYLLSILVFKSGLVRGLAPWLIVYAAGEITGQVPKVSLRIKEKIAAFSAAKVARILLMVALLFFLLGKGVAGIKAVIIAETAAAFAEWILCMVFDRYVPARPLFSSLASLLRVGFPLTLVAFGVFCIDLSDRYVVFELLGSQANGFYAAAGKIAVAASFFIEAFNSMWFPYYLRISAVRIAQGAAIDENLRRFASRLIVLFSLVISLCMMVLPLFVNLRILGRYFVSPQYHAVGVLVAPLVLAFFFKAGFYVSSTIMIAAGKNWSLARTVYIAAFINVAANVLLATHPGADLFQTLSFIAFMTSVSYGLCMVAASGSAGLFRLRFWVTSRYIPLCAAALGLTFVPMPGLARYAAWVLCAAIAAAVALHEEKSKTVLLDK